MSECLDRFICCLGNLVHFGRVCGDFPLFYSLQISCSLFEIAEVFFRCGGRPFPSELGRAVVYHVLG